MSEFELANLFVFNFHTQEIKTIKNEKKKVKSSWRKSSSKETVEKNQESSEKTEQMGEIKEKLDRSARNGRRRCWRS